MSEHAIDYDPIQARDEHALAEHTVMTTHHDRWVCACTPWQWRPWAQYPRHVAEALTHARDAAPHGLFATQEDAYTAGLAAGRDGSAS